MSRLPSVNTTGIPPPTKLVKRQPSLDLRKKKHSQDTAPPLPPLKASKSSRMSRTSVSSYEEMDSPSSRFSASSYGSIQTALTSPRTSVTSPKPSGPRKRLSVKPPPIPAQHLPPKEQQGADPILHIGERVVVDSMNIVGTLKFVGTTRFKPGMWAGIELDIVGTGKNDGAVQGLRYFSCPPETGIFVMASKVAPLDRDDISIRSLSPPSPYSSTPNQANGRTVTQVTKGSRAERYIGLTASQLSQRQHKRSSSSSASKRLSGRSQMPPMQSPTPTGQRRRLSRASTSSSSNHPPPRRSSSGLQQQQQPHHHQQQQHITSSPSHDLVGNDDYYAQDDSLVISDEHMLTDTPVPVNLAMSESTDTPSSIHSQTSASSPPPPSHQYNNNNQSRDEDSQARLERVLGEAIAQAPDEAAMRLQQLQLRVEVLEAENKYLKLENTQNKTAEQILERSMVLKKMKNSANGDNMVDEADKDEYFTLEGHKAIVEEIKQDHDNKKKTWESDMVTMRSSIKKLEKRVFELETEQSELIKERDELLTSLSDARKAKNHMEQRVQELEDKVVVAEANAAAALASRTVQTTANFYSEDADEMQERQRQMEMEMEEVHDKMTSLMDAMRAKDMFLGTLSEQVEQHRNLVEEKERELRRVRMDAERHNRDKERLREEIQDLESKWVGHEGCVTKEEFDSIKRDYAVAKEHLAKETTTVDDYRRRIQTLEQTVDELKAAGMESIELYENSVELNRVAMETINANLQDEQRKVAALELEKAHLVKTGADALDTFEETMTALKQQHAQKLQAFDTERQGWEDMIAKLKQEISQLVDSSNQTEEIDKIKQVWDSERQRLESAIEQHVQQLASEQESNQALNQRVEGLQEQIKQVDKLTMEKQQLEEQVKQLQQNYDEQLQSRTRYLDEIKSAMEAQKKTQSDMRRLTESKEKVDRELELARADLSKAESTLACLSSSSTDMDGWIKEKQQQAKDMETLRNEIERLEAQNTMLAKQKESAELAAKTTKEANDDKSLIKRLKADNKELTQDHESLKESHKQMEMECLKLMDEVEKLHSEGSPTVVNDENDNATPEEKARQLQQQLAQSKRQMEKLLIKHSSEIRQLKDQLQQSDRNHQREIKSLNRDLTELESIIEAKIFKEADLEEALENERKTASRLRDDIMELRERQEASNKDSSARNAGSKDGITGRISNSSSSGLSTNGTMTEDSPYCEICEVSGHDLLSCKVAINPGSNAQKLARPFCENCDEHGLHYTEDCPNQNETF